MQRKDGISYDILIIKKHDFKLWRTISNYQKNTHNTFAAKMRKTSSTADPLELTDQEIDSGRYFVGASPSVLPKRKVAERGVEKEAHLEKSLISLTEVVTNHITAKKVSHDKENIDHSDKDVIFGKLITSQMKYLPDHKKLPVQSKITDLLYKALLEDA